MRTAEDFNLYYATPDPWHISRSRFRDRVLRRCLKQFIRDVAKAVPSPKGGTVYDSWHKSSETASQKVVTPQEAIGDTGRTPAAQGQGYPTPAVRPATATPTPGPWASAKQFP